MRSPDLQSYDRFVVAFSGGKDSIACLLSLLDAGVSPIGSSAITTTSMGPGRPSWIGRARPPTAKRSRGRSTCRST